MRGITQVIFMKEFSKFGEGGKEQNCMDSA